MTVNGELVFERIVKKLGEPTKRSDLSTTWVLGSCNVVMQLFQDPSFLVFVGVGFSIVRTWKSTHTDDDLDALLAWVAVWEARKGR